MILKRVLMYTKKGTNARRCDLRQSLDLLAVALAFRFNANTWAGALGGLLGCLLRVSMSRPSAGGRSWELDHLGVGARDSTLELGGFE